MKSAVVNWTQLSEEQKKHLIVLSAGLDRKLVSANLNTVFPGENLKETRKIIGDAIFSQAQTNSKPKKPKASSAAAPAEP